MKNLYKTTIQSEIKPSNSILYQKLKSELVEENKSTKLIYNDKHRKYMLISNRNRKIQLVEKPNVNDIYHYLFTTKIESNGDKLIYKSIMNSTILLLFWALWFIEVSAVVALHLKGVIPSHAFFEILITMVLISLIFHPLVNGIFRQKRFYELFGNKSH